MPNCTVDSIALGKVGRPVIEASFDGGDLSSDAGFCRPPALRRFEKWGVHYIIGLQKNAALLKRVALAELALADAYAASGIKQRMIGQFDYAAGTRERERRVIARLEHDAHGANPRFVVTIRVKRLKIGAAIVRNTRRVRVLLASQHPRKHVFLTAARALAP